MPPSVFLCSGTDCSSYPILNLSNVSFSLWVNSAHMAAGDRKIWNGKRSISLYWNSNLKKRPEEMPGIPQVLRVCQLMEELTQPEWTSSQWWCLLHQYMYPLSLPFQSGPSLSGQHLHSTYWLKVPSGICTISFLTLNSFILSSLLFMYPDDCSVFLSGNLNRISFSLLSWTLPIWPQDDRKIRSGEIQNLREADQFTSWIPPLPFTK